MSYTPPPGDSLVFSFAGQPAYTPPSGDSLVFSFVPTQTTGGPLAMAAGAVMELVGKANLVIQALAPLRAVGTLSVQAIGILRSLGTLMLKALARIGLVGQRVAPAAPRGLGMKMTLVTDPRRPELILDQFLRLWYWGLPSAVRVAYQVDDQPEQQPAAVWENPGQTQPAILRIDGAEIPGAVGLFVKFTEGLKTTIAQIGVADHDESEYLAEGIALLIRDAIGLLDVYFGVAAVARNQYGPITWATPPIKIPGIAAINTPTPLNPDRYTREDIEEYTLLGRVRDELSGQLGASVPANLETLVRTTQLKLWRRIKDVIRKGGTVELDDFGTFKANWSASGRSVSFVPSLGFKVGTQLGKALTDTEAQARP